MSLSEDEIAPIAEGSRYKDYESFRRALATYSLENNVVFTTQKSKKIETHNNASKVLPKFNSNLKMAYFTMACKHYGSVRKRGNKTTTGQRPKQKTYKTGCPAVINVVADRKCNELRINRLISEHNHETGPEQVQLYPERRRLSRAETTQLQEQLKNCQIKPADLQEYIRLVTNKNVTKKDIYNIRHQILQSPLKVAKKQQQTNHQPSHRPTAGQKIVELRENYEESDVYADDDTCLAEDEGEDHFTPSFLAEEEVEEATAAPSADPLGMERVNEAWKCVYMVLEEENRKLREETARLNETVKRLEAEAKKPCPKCAERKGAACASAKSPTNPQFVRVKNFFTCNNRVSTSPSAPHVTSIRVAKPTTSKLRIVTPAMLSKAREMGALVTFPASILKKQIAGPAGVEVVRPQQAKVQVQAVEKTELEVEDDNATNVGYVVAVVDGASAADDDGAMEQEDGACYVDGTLDGVEVVTEDGGACNVGAELADEVVMHDDECAG